MRSITEGRQPAEGSSRISSLRVADHALSDREDLLLSAGQPRGHLAAGARPVSGNS
jgi:hypothetical protein